MGEEKAAANDEQSPENEAIKEVVDSLEDPTNAGLILEEQAKSLKNILADPAVQHLFKAHGALEQERKEAVKNANVELIKEVLLSLEGKDESEDAVELHTLLSNPHVKGLIESHDAIANKAYDVTPPLALPDSADSNGSATGEPIRMVGLNKSPNESLGLTLKQRGGQIIVARIIKGSTIDKQGLLNVGDVIKEVNGQPVKNDPEKVQNILKDSSTKVTLKVSPNYASKPYHGQVFVKTQFSFDPTTDDDIPCKEAGLAFQKGEVLEILDQTDATWWQAKKVDGDGYTGLIPSRTLQEKRRTFIHPNVTHRRSFFMCGSRKKKKTMYDVKKTQEFDRHAVASYEEVAKKPPFERKTLILVGAEGVGRRTLKNRIVANDPTRFGTAIPHTSREPKEGEEDGKGYHFVSRDKMAELRRGNQFLEHGEYNGNTYGTSIESVRTVVDHHKMCILDLQPAGLKMLDKSEFKPYIVFIASPGVDELSQRQDEAPSNARKLTTEEMSKIVEHSEVINRDYSQHFDLTIVNKNVTDTYERLMKSIEGLSADSQWVPVSWAN
ncbi:MAGUK p55 subfamily member 2-like [Dendronephthya gigantea]|uniref:MAGUK p55 subfamily member 2-like n=1 Tax=Dendronephthya gigantea TaxID=151771 RepID=UPI00106C3818|nr:MAGUK p55 subfamily member 2-like [Dendronephthya gigantea]